MINSLQELLEKKPEEVQTWWKNVCLGNQNVPDKFNWHGLADCAASKARELVNKFSEDHRYSLIWAEVAVSIYEFLAQKYPNASESYLYSSMTLRAYMILNFGVISGYSVLDTNKIVKWFFDNLNISYQEAFIKSADWQAAILTKNPEEMRKKFENNLEDIRILRFIKTRLNVIKLLCQSSTFQPSQELKDWISLWKQLP
jgi:hypothetical protein